jgi:hypothetical protein
MLIADGTKTIEGVRAADAEKKRITRAGKKKKGSPGRPGETTPALTWQDDDVGTFCAVTSRSGQYWVKEDNGHYLVTYAPSRVNRRRPGEEYRTLGEEIASLKEAKALAQADYERYSAPAPAPAPAPTPAPSLAGGETVAPTTTAPADFDLIHGNPWELARIIIAKVDGQRARNIACTILDGLNHKLDKPKSFDKFMGENSAAAAKLRDENQRLKIKCDALKGEVEDLKVEIEKLKTPDMLDALVTLLRATPEDERGSVINGLMKAAFDKAKGNRASEAPPPSNSTDAIGQWQIKPKKYVTGWSWFATDGSVSLNSNPATLFATQDEAETDARAAIARAGQSQPAAIAEERRR